jgi:Tol biopolymer transport system component
MLNRSRLSRLFLLPILAASSLFGQREPVLKQIHEPHSYYYREMYIPQLTTGPSAVAWSPDSQSLVYSMGGSLWQQQIASQVAEQLTSGPGYDYQPDCSSDGRWIVYASYFQDAIELWALDTLKHQAHQLTSSGAVNVEPRFSPDGKRLAFVSTSFNGHFHIFVADFASGALSNVQQLTSENRSPLPRYYYSPFDHEISPVWSSDGSEILFVSNRGHVYGTGGFWRMKAVPGSLMREIHYEETTWRARPDISPDGTRVVYGSYLGRNWHQLWIMPAQGGDPLPISYGDFDDTNPRWSKDGKQIAFISNRDGNTSLWVQQAQSGGRREVVISKRHYLKPVGKLVLTVLDSMGHPTPARVFITGSDGRAYSPDDAWMNADDNFTRSERSSEAHYFHMTGTAELSLPIGQTSIGAMKGFAYHVAKETVTVATEHETRLTVQLKPISVPREPRGRWVSGDAHVHMNYAGLYRNTPAHMLQQAAAEDLDIVEDLVVNKEQRIPDISYFRTDLDPASTASNLLLYGQEFHTSYWGHLGLLGLTRNLVIPGYAAYPNTAAASLVPMNADVADMGHAQGALVGYVHPFEKVPDPATDALLTSELPADVALSKVDYIEVTGFSDHKSTASVWYRLLNLGFHLPAAAGTDAMSNFASLHGPVGLNRAYALSSNGRVDARNWLDSIKNGHTFVTNGPQLGFTLNDRIAGDQIELPAGNHELRVAAWMRSIVPLDHLEIVCNGQVVHDVKLQGDRESADISTILPVSHSAWCLLRAWADRAEDPILDLYPYATTSPIFIAVAGAPLRSKEDAGYFMAWIDRLIAAANADQGWNNPAEKEHVLSTLQSARQVYADLQR